MKTDRISCLALLLGTLTLAGCNGDELSRNFGLTRDAPDEFQVTTRAPLSIPPDFSLRPPEPGAPRPQEQSTTQSAEATLAPETVLTPQAAATDSPGQDALLAAAGPRPPSDIRNRVDAETAKAGDGQYLTDKLMFWKDPPPPGVIVDSKQEAQRLRDNAALGQSPATGDTPMIKRKSTNFLDTLF